MIILKAPLMIILKVPLAWLPSHYNLVSTDWTSNKCRFCNFLACLLQAYTILPLKLVANKINKYKIHKMWWQRITTITIWLQHHHHSSFHRRHHTTVAEVQPWFEGVFSWSTTTTTVIQQQSIHYWSLMVSPNYLSSLRSAVKVSCTPLALNRSYDW